MIAAVAAGDRVHRVEDRDVDDRHRAARAAGAELLAEHAGLAGLHRRVVEAARVDRDLVPAQQALERIGAAPRCTVTGAVAELRRRLEARPERVAVSAREAFRPRARRERRERGERRQRRRRDHLLRRRHHNDRRNVRSASWLSSDSRS